ncbi:hypothetical protein Hanom_Chr12g01166101 [Helianthus anomalus]
MQSSIFLSFKSGFLTVKSADLRCSKMMSSWCSYELHVLASFHQEQLRSGRFLQDLTTFSYKSVTNHV